MVPDLLRSVASASTLRLRMPLAHQRASHLRRPQSERDGARTFLPFPATNRAPYHTVRVRAPRGPHLWDCGFLGFEPVAALLTVLACPLGSHRKWRNEATRPGCAPGRLVRIIERAHNAHGAENRMNAPRKLNKPLELHARDTLDGDPLAELCPGST